MRDALIKKRGFNELMNALTAFFKPVADNRFPEVDFTSVNEEDPGAVGLLFSCGCDDTVAADEANEVRNVERISCK